MIDTELLQGFKEESNALVGELKSVVEKLEAPVPEFPTALFQEFSQKIDRIMGAAKTLSVEDPSHQGLRRIGAIAELCKYIGYKAAEQKQPKIVPIVAAFWSDVIGVTEDLLRSLEDETKTAQITQDFAPILGRRLEWLKKKVLPTSPTSGNASQTEIDRLLSTLLK